MTAKDLTVERLAPAGQIWQTGLLAAGIASGLNLMVYGLAAALGVSFNVAPPGMPAPPFAVMVIMATLVGIMAGTLLLTLMPRFTTRPVTVFRNVAIVVLVLSLAQPLMLLLGLMPVGEPVGWNTVLALEVMHIVAGVVAIVLLTRRARAA